MHDTHLKRKHWSWVFRMVLSSIEICDSIRQLFISFLFTFEKIKIVSIVLNICRSMQENDYKQISSNMLQDDFLPSCLLPSEVKTDTVSFHLFQLFPMNIRCRLYNVTHKRSRSVSLAVHRIFSDHWLPYLAHQLKHQLTYILGWENTFSSDATEKGLFSKRLSFSIRKYDLPDRIT